MVVGSSPNLVKVVEFRVGKVVGPLLDHHLSSFPNIPVHVRSSKIQLLRSSIMVWDAGSGPPKTEKKSLTLACQAKCLCS